MIMKSNVIIGRPKNCKVVINNRNRLTTTKNMVDKLLELNADEQIIIIDNGSTYPPLLEWYNNINNPNIAVHFEKNEGHLALWATQLDKELGEYFVYTDSDIILPDEFPKGWKLIMYHLIKWYSSYDKIALALHIDDLPDHYRYKNQVKRNEARWWLEKYDSEMFDYLYKADTDTTFAMMRNFGDNCYKSLRISKPNMMARHHGWYLDLDNLDEEERYYLDHLQNTTTQYSKQHKNPELYNDI
jgi:glycosyltransferase involved in cell wall biosynthesis